MATELEGLPEEKLRYLAQLLGRAKDLDASKAAQENFMTFVKQVWPDFIGGRHHKIMAEKFEGIASGKIRRLIINMPPRHALVVDTPIPTTNGWKTMATVQPGDYVFGPDGKPTKVLGKSEVYHDKELYRVTTTDGESVYCDADHLWTVRTKTGRNDNFHTETTKFLHERQYVHAPRLPDYSPLEYPERDLFIPPYVLGVWLGDGSSWHGSFGMDPKDHEHFRSMFEARGIKTTKTASKYGWGTRGLNQKLREMGLIRNKHIPAEYLIASVQQRLELLQGLIDTDGNVGADGKVEFNNSNYDLIVQVQELVHSLGAKCRITSRQTHYKGVPSAPSYRLMFKMANAATLPRKAKNCRPMRGNISRTIRIEKAKFRGDVQCLRVDREDGLFIAGRGHLVTHNTKSEFASYLLPAWLIGRRPKLKIMQTTHTAELAFRFGRKVRTLMEGEEYKKIFQQVGLRADDKAAGRWSTNQGGEYFAAGVGGAVTGRGADLLIIDDPHSEQDALSPSALEHAYEWYTSGPRQRLQPGGSIVIVMTRWAENDLTGKVLRQMQRDILADKWEVVEFPALMPSGEPLWPEFWKKEDLLAVKGSLSVGKWEAQWQQNPTSESSAILKREWWRKWEGAEMPKLSYVMQSYDTAYSKQTHADYSAITTWGVFYPREDEAPNIILLDAQKGRWDFPDLRRTALDEYKYWNPEAVLIESKASGMPLTQELRAMGIPVVNYSPSRGNDKITRVNSIAPLFEAGLVWAPDARWAEEVIEECAAFPAGEHDDYVDTVTQALRRFREGGFITHPEDWKDERERAPRQRVYY